MKCTHCGRKIDKHEHDFDNDGYPVCHICWLVEDECNDLIFKNEGGLTKWQNAKKWLQEVNVWRG